MKGAIAKAKELEQEIENAVILGQFVNTANPRAHEKTTGPEIWEDTQGQVDLFVAGVGTGGTITGTGAYLKSVNPSIEIVAVEPASSAVLSGENPGPHGLQGIGAGFVPDVLNTSVYDRISKVKAKVTRPSVTCTFSPPIRRISEDKTLSSPKWQGADNVTFNSPFSFFLDLSYMVVVGFMIP